MRAKGNEIQITCSTANFTKMTSVYNEANRVPNKKQLSQPSRAIIDDKQREQMLDFLTPIS